LRVVADVSIVPDQRLIPCSAKETILSAALREGIPFAHACGGRALCSTCRVLVVDGRAACTPRTTKERAIADRLGFTDEFRLACQTSITAEVTVRRLVLDNEDVELADLRGRSGRLRAGRRRRTPTTDPAPLGHASPLGEELHVAVLFADIRGFTPFSQALLPYDVIHELQRHVQQVTRAVERQGGVVTSYMGDGVMALFLPGDGPSPSVRAARAGLEMLAHSESRCAELDERYGRTFDINVGLHHGPAIVGALWGNPPTLTAIGDTVNLAARVEQANKDLGTRFLVTHAAVGELGDAGVYGQTFKRCLPGVVGELALVELLNIS
jgi:class 3 adenylate cyclase